MEGVAGLDDCSLHTKRAPANREVDKQVHQRLKRLTQVRALIRNNKSQDDDLLREDPELYSDLWESMNPDTPFRLEHVSATQIYIDMRQARPWLLQIIALQNRHLPRENMIRTLSTAIQKNASEWTEMETLYMALTEAGANDAEERLDNAYAIVLHHGYATKLADALKRLLEQEDRRVRLEKNRIPTCSPHEAIRNRILNKMQSVKVDNFACAIPISEIVNSPDSENCACPVCQNDYLDFLSFDISDLIADYPVKIKYCGHIIGKSCLETWMDTPLADAAKYPHRTCPICRTKIEGRDCPILPEFLQNHLEDNEKANHLEDKLGVDDDECWDALTKLMSEEIVLEELLGELEGKMIVDGEGDRLNKAKTVLRDRLVELGEEKVMWGFRRKEEDWKNARNEWVELVVKTRLKDID